MAITKLFSLFSLGALANLSGLVGILAGLFGIGFLIGFHELGHFLFAKLFNVRTPSFSIGFGPRLFTKKIGETEFSLSAIPLGGYVELAGAGEPGQGEQKEADRNDEFSFKTKPFYQKFLIMIGGILFNLIFAWVALIGIFKIGLPETNHLYPLNAVPVIQRIEQDSPAQMSDLQAGDTIKTFNGVSVTSALNLLQTIGTLANKNVELTIERDGQEIAKSVTIGSKTTLGKEVGFLGVTFKISALPAMSLTDALQQGSQLAYKIVASTVYSFKYIFAQRDLSAVRGPIFLISETAQGASKGLGNFIIFLAIISINLAVLNLIPLPILDGGQILFYALEAISGRSIPTKIREYIFITTWLAFISLFIYLSYKDILALFGKLFK